MGMISADLRPRYDKARVEAREIYVDNPTLTTPQIATLLKARGYEFAKPVTIKAWKRQDLWPRRIKAAADEFDLVSKVLLAQPLTSGAPMPMTADRIETLERFHGAAIVAGATLAAKMTSWANKLDPGKITVAEGLQVARELPPVLEALAKIHMLIADAKHHMPTISAPEPGRAAPRTIDVEPNKRSAIGDAVADITQELQEA